MANNINSFKKTPRFVDTISDTYRCVLDKEVLRGSVKMLICGHRLCEECYNDLILENKKLHAETTCVGDDEECKQTILTDGNVFEDKGTMKELQKMEVYCLNENYGCDFIMRWSELDSHLNSCLFNPVKCPNNPYGCLELFVKEKLDGHIKNCEYKAVLCSFCNEMILEKEMDTGHRKKCSSLPKDCKYHVFGCRFQGLITQINDHMENDIDQHLDIIVKYIIKAVENGQALKIDVQKRAHETASMRMEVEDIMKKLGIYVKKFEHLLQRLENINVSNTTKINDLRKMVNLIDNVQQLQIKARNNEARVTELENGTITHGLTQETTVHVTRIMTSVDNHHITLSEFELRAQCLETASYDGKMVWMIKDYARRKNEAVRGETISLYSQPFYTSRSGYKMCARLYLNGDGMGKNTHISLFFVLMKGDFDSIQKWPFQHRVTFTIYNQDNLRDNISSTFKPDISSTSFKRPVSEMNVASGCPLFVSQSTIEEGRGYIKDDVMYIKVLVHPLVQ